MTERVDSQPLALIVEDDRVSAIILGEWLKKQGWSVERLENGSEALKRFGEIHPDLLLADVLLPGLDGVGLCAQIRLQPFGEHIKIGLMSALPQMQAASLNAGADFFAAKPIRFDELSRQLQHAKDHPLAGSEPVISPGLPPLIPVRVPTAPALGRVERPWNEEGPLSPGAFLTLLHALYEGKFTGVLECVDHQGVKTKVFFDRGIASAARSNDTQSGFARILERITTLSSDVINDALEESRRSRLFLGEVLLKNKLIDSRTIERALREQILMRMLVLDKIPSGSYTLQAAESMGLAGFDVHPAAVEWRLGLRRSFSGPNNLYIHLDQVSSNTWELLDPTGELRPLVMLLKASVEVSVFLHTSPYAGALLALLLHYKLIALVNEPSDHGFELDRGSAHLEEVERDIAQRWQISQDATLYTVLGVRPDADTETIQLTALSQLSSLSPDILLPGLSAETLERARRLSERIREASRILGDPARRSIYDARLTVSSELTVFTVTEESSAELQADRAREHFRKNEFVTASSLFHLAISKAKTDDAELLAMLGWARHRACPEDAMAGETELRKAVDLDGENEFALCYLGRVLGDQGRKEEAIRILKSAIALNHEFEAARDALKKLQEPQPKPSEKRPA